MPDGKTAVAALIALALGAAGYAIAGIGTGRSAVEMTRSLGGLLSAPGGETTAEDYPASPIPALFLLWWAIALAAVIPATGPDVLRHANRSAPHGLGSGLVLAAGVAAALAGFALAAATVQRALELRGMVSGGTMRVTHPLLAGGILVAVGLFQFSALKPKALMHSRGFARRRPPAGDFGTGLRCGGCCLVWCGPMFLLLFFAEVMNLYWLAILMAAVVVERLVPRGDSVGLGAGGVLMLWGMLLLISATEILEPLRAPGFLAARCRRGYD